MSFTYLFFVVFLGYFTALTLYFVNFEFRKDALLSLAQRVALTTATGHFALFGALLIRSGHFLILTLSESVYLGSLLILLFSFWMERRYQTRFLMLFSLPVVLFLLFFATLLMPQETQAEPYHDPSWLWVHAGLIAGGFAGLLVAASSAVMYLLQSAQLKSKQLGRVFLKLPSLSVLDKLHFTSLSWGVILFSLGILSGLFWAKDIQELGQVMKDPKVTLSFLTCLMYWVVLSLRLGNLRRGQKIAVGTLLALLLLFVTLMSSAYAPSGYHRGL
jgi:ABC-type transport system involved in cytochrome c biogenesis permease subunit